MATDTVGSRLRHYRRLRRLSQQQLADRAGISRQYLADLERGKVTIPREPDNLKALAAALDVALRELAEPTGWYEDVRDDDWKSAIRAAVKDADRADRIISVIEPAVKESQRTG
jgi:transcriptional regulator with XRE-family HTH domain